MYTFMDLESEKKRLKKASKYTIKFTVHAEQRLDLRNISKSDVEDNLRDPEKLTFVKLDKQDKYKKEYYFWLSNTLTHKYIVRIDDHNRVLNVITVIKIRNKWQRRINRILR